MTGRFPSEQVRFTGVDGFGPLAGEGISEGKSPLCGARSASSTVCFTGSWAVEWHIPESLEGLVEKVIRHSIHALPQSLQGRAARQELMTRTTWSTRLAHQSISQRFEPAIKSVQAVDERRRQRRGALQQPLDPRQRAEQQIALVERDDQFTFRL